MNKKASQEHCWEEFQLDTWPPTASPSLTVFDDGPQSTGLVDSEGAQIMKSKPRIGFLA